MNKIEKMKLGRRRAYLKKCIKAATLLEQHESDTSIRKRVFDKFIHPELQVSYTSFNNMLNEPNPTIQLDEINKKLDV